MNPTRAVGAIVRVYRISGAVKILTALQLDDFQLKIVFDLIFDEKWAVSEQRDNFHSRIRVESALNIPRHQVESHGNGFYTFYGTTANAKE